MVAMGRSPDQGQFFALGGGTLFRGFDLAERQGSCLWVANAELRLPLVRDVEWDVPRPHGRGAERVAGGASTTWGRCTRTAARSAAWPTRVGAGLRVDVAVFSFIERATLRFDVGKTINANTPFQFWFGVQHPF